MLEWLSLPPFPKLQIYIPKKIEQRVPVFGTGTKEVWEGREECVLEIGLSPLPALADWHSVLIQGVFGLALIYSIFLQITHLSYNGSFHILEND